MTEEQRTNSPAAQESQEVAIDDSYSFSLGLHPSDSGYGDSPNSLSASGLR